MTWPGEEKIPDPMIKPTINDSPFKYVNVLCFSNDTPPNPVAGSEGAIASPIRAYPLAVVDDNGKRLDVNSKADDTENVLLCPAGLPSAAALCVSKGSSASSESFREEETPCDELESVEARPSGEDEASDASSRESRVSLFTCVYRDIAFVNM